VTPFDVLSDDVLLDIFDFYIDSASYEGTKTAMEAWQLLVHVCRRWRSLVFRSPRRLNLQLFCTPETRARDALASWPALPLIVDGDMTISSSMDNIIAALGHSNRVCRLSLEGLEDRHLEKVLEVVQVPFPELTYVRLFSSGETPPVIPDSFLGGSAPLLQFIDFSGIPFPGLPTLLLSATNLDNLSLLNIPHSGYISPEAMVAALSALSSLRILSFDFRSRRSHPDQETRSPPPPERSILPVLWHLYFGGATEYLEDFATLIDAPQLKSLEIGLFDQINFDTHQLAEFINRTPKLGEKRHEAHVEFADRGALLLFGTIDIFVPFKEPVRRLSSVAQVCNCALSSTVDDLYIERQPIQSPLVWQNDAIEITRWSQLLLPFTAVKNLYLRKEFAPGIAAALQGLAAGITEVLPSLQNIFVEELEPSVPSSFQENIGQFVAARQLSDHPIVISDWHNVEFLYDAPDPDFESGSDDDDTASEIAEIELN
jgi:hypothetical protein